MIAIHKGKLEKQDPVRQSGVFSLANKLQIDRVALG